MAAIFAKKAPSEILDRLLNALLSAIQEKGASLG